GWIMDTFSMRGGRAIPGIVTGKPVELGGSLGRRDATGRGAVYVLKDTMKRLKYVQDRSTAVLAGFGKVGRSAAMSMYDEGIRIVAISDSTGGIRREEGLDVPGIVEFKLSGGHLCDYKAANVKHISLEETLKTPCTILAPCAGNTIIDEKIAPEIQAEIVLECGDAQVTMAGNEILEEREITVIPDLVATTGGVIVDYFERVQNVQSLMWDEYEVNRMMKNLLLKTFDKVWETAGREKFSLRMASFVLALEKVCDAKRIRGIFP
ncbi:MAG: glutamate dehydrogenase, partial [Clostridia bacterium]|nr:glutamate dehydrogenase [Clostridia bacterium]